MKTHLSSLLLFALLAALGAGCATTQTASLQSKEQMVASAGFKAVTPSQPDQVALLPKLPAGKVSKITYHGKTYYVLPDLANNRAYVGGPKQYNVYQAMRDEQNLADDDRETTELNAITGGTEIREVEWSSWGGWKVTEEQSWY